MGRSSDDAGLRVPDRLPESAPDSRRGVRIALGAIIASAGVLLLIEAASNYRAPDLLWSGLLVLASAAFGYAFVASPGWWWAAIPAGALLGAAMVPVMELDPAGFGQWTEVPFLAALGAGFWAVYLKEHRRWWAVIPGGALLTLSIASAVTGTIDGQMTGAVVLSGLAVTFALVALLPSRGARRWWAWIVAGALALAAVIVLIQDAGMLSLLGYLWPLAIIAGGVYLFWSAWRRRPEVDESAENRRVSPGRPHLR